MCIGGEEDVRGAYCSLVIVSLLEIPLDLPRDAPARKAGLKTLVDGLPEYLSRCQTYEGGISGAPQTEAHGAYAYCALASLCILGPPEEMLQRFAPMIQAWKQIADMTVQVSGSPGIDLVAIITAICAGRWLLWANEQTC